MRLKNRILTVPILVALASSALAIGSAQAAEWRAPAETFPAALASTVKTTSSYTFTSAGLTITCRSLAVSGGQLELPNKGKAQKLTFGECTMAGGNCTLRGNAIATGEVTMLASLSGTEAVSLAVKPASGTKFGEVNFQGEKCAIKGLAPVKLKEESVGLKLSLSKGQKLSASQPLTVNSKTELLIGSLVWELTGAGNLSLASSREFDFS